MRRIGFQRLLPPVQLVLFGLLWVASGRDSADRPCSGPWFFLAAPVYAQGEAEVGFPRLCRTPLAEFIAVDLSFPPY
jgi:hypothetical protein